MRNPPPSPHHNVASLLARSARAWPALPALARGATVLCDYATLAARAARLAGAFARMRSRERRSRRARLAQRARLHRNAVRLLVGGPRRRSDQREAPRAGARVRDRRLRRAVDLRGPALACAHRVRRRRLRRSSRASSSSAVPTTSASRPAILRRRSPPCAPDDPAWLFYTSGTTGRPKGVEITHGNLGAMSAAFVASVEPIAPGDALLHPAPLSHGSGLYLLPHVAGGAVSVVPESGGFDAAEICALLSTWDRAAFFAAPTMVKRLVAAREIGDARLDRLKCIVYGGGPMYVADARAAFAALGPRLAQIYGQGESPMTITAMNRAAIADAIRRGDDARLASVGTAQVGVELRIADADDRELPTGDVGEILVRGPTVMRGYWQKSGGDAQHARERLAPHRRRRPRGCRRLPDAHRPLEGPHHQRRIEHLSARSGGSAAAASGRGGGGGGRPRPRRLGRGSRRLRRRPRQSRAGGRAGARASAASSTSGVSSASRASSGRRRMSSSPSCPRTTPARC